MLTKRKLLKRIEELECEVRKGHMWFVLRPSYLRLFGAASEKGPHFQVRCSLCGKIRDYMKFDELPSLMKQYVKELYPNILGTPTEENEKQK